MEQIQAFKANDGTLFETEEAAKSHEKRSRLEGLVTQFLDTNKHQGDTRLTASNTIMAWEEFKSGLGDPLLSQALALPMQHLHLSTRAYNCLKAEGILTVGDLMKWSPNALLKTPNLGRRSLNEIKEAMGDLGLCLPAIGFGHIITEIGGRNSTAT
jgi:DNA-directed RNA polymerase alpha subunit